MADVKVLGNRYISLVLGLALLLSSIYLIYSIRLSISELLFSTITYFNPYFLYFVGLLIGFERFAYGITGNKKFSYFFIGRSEYSGMYLYFFFMFGLIMGIYIAVYAIAMPGFLLKIIEVIEGLGFILFALSLITI
ncbi:hypothetical protein DFR86_05485 [Acidianus sulfidivorans JP7]|uniref:C4-dicarboxylate ABC transporter permease n=1 Tax=Acidianus sulfidivorans JP7 TaxID=619593 RepID=A0A2U9IM12_9CREN|nr:hypothetical protein [Acidianus sulfidivorans]AWR97066.1 hypothetical protein DFR86_05485 [Acidianus sulfidivorans JP7]